ncbi:caspase family protein [Elusimicrobiota bacterium]
MRRSLAAATCLLLLSGATLPSSLVAAPKPELNTQGGHSSLLFAIGMSPDGRFALTGSDDSTARIWDAESGIELRSFTGHSGIVAVVDMDSRGDRVFTAAEDGTVRFWDPATGKELRKIRAHDKGVLTAALSRDDILLVTGSRDKTARLWDLGTGRMLREFAGHSDMVWAAAVVPGGRWVVTGSNEGEAYLWDIKTGKKIRDFEGHSGTVDRILPLPDGRRIITCDDKGGHLWDLDSGERIRSYGYSSFDGDLSPDGKRLALVSSDVRIYDVETGESVAEFKKNAMIVRFGAHGKHLLTAYPPRGDVFLWDLESRKRIRKIEPRASWVSSLDIGPNGRYLALGNWNGVARIWDLLLGKEIRTLNVTRPVKDYMMPGSVGALAFTPDGEHIVIGSSDHNIQRWGVDSGERTWTSGQGTGRIVAVDVTEDGRYVAAGAWGGEGDTGAELWDMDRGERVTDYRGHDGSVNALAIGPKEEHLVTGGQDKTLRVWRLRGKQKQRSFDEPGRVRAVAISPNGKIGAGSSGISVRKFPRGKLLANLGSGKVHSLLFLDKTRLVAGMEDGTARIWDLELESELRKLDGHSGAVASLALFPDGKRLATGSKDGSVGIWDLETGALLCRLISLKGGWLAITPDGYFDGSREAMARMRWTLGLRSYPLEAFSEGYYAPGLLPRVLAGKSVASADLPALTEGFSPPPEVEIVSPEDGATLNADSVTVKVVATDQGGGIDEIRLYHNGKALSADSRGLRIMGRGKRKIRVFQVPLADGENRLRAVALSDERIEGSPREIAVTLTAPEKTTTLHVLAVGINEYENPALNLNYARTDARGLADFFRSSPQSLFREVKTRELYDGQATKKAILEGLSELEKTPPQDVVLVYLAGHGDSLADTWYFIPHELARPEREEQLRSRALSSDELKDRVRAIGARKVVLALDACKSGGALMAFAVRGFEERKALARLARAVGVHIIAASSKDQFASEVKELGHGAFTHTMLQALKGAADGSPKDGTVTVRELSAYVDTVLPEVSRKHKSQAQYPVVDSRGMDFPLSRP